MLSLDANVLFYAADRTAGIRHAIAKQVVDNAAAANSGLTEQSLFEFFHAATRKAKMSIADAAEVVRQLAADFDLMFPPRTIISDAIALQARYSLNIWDARLLAVCAAHSCDYLLSEDMQDGAQYGGVKVVNPFKPANAHLLQQALTR